MGALRDKLKKIDPIHTLIGVVQKRNQLRVTISVSFLFLLAVLIYLSWTQSYTISSIAPPIITQNALPSSEIEELNTYLKLYKGDRIFFGFNDKTSSPRVFLTLDAQRIVGDWINWLKENPTLIIVLEGHTDDRGSSVNNLYAGREMANLVRDYMIANGIDAGRISIFSYGSERPYSIGVDDQVRAQNRRVVIRVISGTSPQTTN